MKHHDPNNAIDAIDMNKVHDAQKQFDESERRANNNILNAVKELIANIVKAKNE